MKTTLFTYSFDTSKALDHAAHESLCRMLEQSNGYCFNVLAGQGDSIEAGEVTIDTEHLFADQWNVTDAHGKGWRVFDWYEGIYPNKSIKRGHYLQITDEMREIRRNTNVCGFCGHQERAERGLVFCDRCLDSPYLKSDELHLTRMMSVELRFPERKPLTSAERAHLMPEYVRRQTTGADSRNAAKLAKQRANIKAKADREIKNATIERDGLIWLMDHGISVDNVIFYDHRRVFSFGWQSKVSDEVASAILAVISEFPFAYEIKGVSRTWESAPMEDE